MYMISYGGESLSQVSSILYLLMGSSSVLVADALVEAPDKDG